MTGRRSPWDATWEAELAAPPRPEVPSLENSIDADKLEFLRDVLPRAGSAIEIGCGSARLLARVRQAADLRAFGLDPSPQALQLAARTAVAFAAPMTLLSADAVRLPLRDQVFDLVLSGGLLEHFEDPRAVISEMVRILRPGGVFYADVVPRKFSLYRVRELPRMWSGADLMAGVHESSFGPDRYRAILSSLGCRDIRVRSAGVYPPGSGAGWARRTAALDGTVIADWLGWYFMISARRAS